MRFTDTQPYGTTSSSGLDRRKLPRGAAVVFHGSATSHPASIGMPQSIIAISAPPKDATTISSPHIEGVRS